MKNSLEEKRKEIFELHKSWLSPETSLMRKTAQPAAPVNTEGKKAIHIAASEKNWFSIAVIIITIIAVIMEFLFFAYESGWFK